MNWINFISDHPGRLAFTRIGRSIYTEVTNHTVESNTLTNWLRTTDNRVQNGLQ